MRSPAWAIAGGIAAGPAAVSSSTVSPAPLTPAIRSPRSVSPAPGGRSGASSLSSLRRPFSAARSSLSASAEVDAISSSAATGLTGCWLTGCWRRAR